METTIGTKSIGVMLGGILVQNGVADFKPKARDHLASSPVVI